MAWQRLHIMYKLEIRLIETQLETVVSIYLPYLKICWCCLVKKQGLMKLNLEKFKLNNSIPN